MTDYPHRTCLRDAIPEIAQAATFLDEAANAYLAGDRTEAIRLINAADIRAIDEWSISIMGKFTEHNRPISPLGDPPIRPLAERSKPRMPSAALKKALHDQFGYRCCFCGIPVIRKSVRIRLTSLFPELLRGDGTKFTKNAMIRVMEAQYDHVLPHSRGGATSFENMLITCAPCNYGRWHFTLGEMGLVDPRSRQLVRSNWDGLERFMRSDIPGCSVPSFQVTPGINV
ncbi:MAG TPA: HNH endonuclease [Terracidiphilus sp.]|jgi:hypothetical protein|nr:HNH endonuclease [Terracidiphilus sp.]